MWKIKRKKKDAGTAGNQENVTRENVQALFDSLLTIARAAKSYQKKSSKLLLILSRDQVQVLSPLLSVEFRPSIEDLEAYAAQHNLTIREK